MSFSASVRRGGALLGGYYPSGVVLQLLDKDIERYGLISVTEKGKAFYESPQTLMLGS